MKLTDIFKFADKPAAPALTELGDTGTTMYNGMISGEEYNYDLSGTAKYTVYDKMRKGDATIAATIRVLKLPLRSANWYIEPAGEDKLQREQADFIEYNLKEGMSVTWDDFLRQALLMLDYGVFVFEKVFDNVEFNGKTYIGWRKFAPRHPRTITNWKINDGKDDGIIQQKTVGGTVSIPMDKLLIFVNEKEGDNWEGISILRAAYKNWFFKDIFEQIDAMAFERQGLGVPYCKIPSAANAKDKANATAIVKNLRANEKAYVVFPEGFEVGFLDMGAGKTRDPKTSIEYHNRQIALNVLAQFLMLGSGDKGSFALSKDQSTLFYDSLQAVAKGVLDVINKYAIQQLIELNWPGTKVYPKLKVDDIGAIDKVQFATMINTLVGADIIPVDENLDKYIRKELDLPELSEEAKKQIEEAKKNPPAPAPAPAPAPQPAKANEKKNLKMLSEAFKPYRKFTAAEGKINFGNLKNEMDRGQVEFTDLLKGSLMDEKSSLLSAFEQAIKTSDYKAIQDIALTDSGKYKAEVFNKMKALYNFGKNTVTAEMKVSTPANPKEEMQRLNAEASVLVDYHEIKILTKLKMCALDRVAKGVAVIEAMDNITAALDEAISELTADTASIIVGKAINQGRRLTQAENSGDIYAYQRSELLDDATCAFCLSVDGRVVDVDDPMAQEDIFHSNCRGIWVEILKDEAELPEVNGIPKAITDRYNGLNDFKQLKSPQVTKTSLAADTVKEEYKKQISEREAKLKTYEADNTYPDRQAAHKKAIARMKKVIAKLK
jgi:hypothetical protein